MVRGADTTNTIVKLETVRRLQHTVALLGIYAIPTTLVGPSGTATSAG
jgi:hypothetical protein